MQVCQAEHQLFEHFFPASAGDAASMRPLLEPLCTILYDALRPTFISMSEMDQLCELVDIMRHEVLQVRSRGWAYPGAPLTCDPRALRSRSLYTTEGMI